MHNSKSKKIYIALENIRSLNNVGAILRTCSFLGINNVVLVGISGVLDMGSHKMLNPKVTKTSLGAEDDLNIIMLDSSKDLVSYSKQNNLSLIAVEQFDNSVQLNDFSFKNISGSKESSFDGAIFVFGHERDGVSKYILESADIVLEIPRIGNKSSLNVATAVGIVLGHLVFSA